MDQVVDDLLYCYRAMHERFFSQRSLIPDGNYIGICYEDFVAAPLATLRDIYARLGLPGFDEDEKLFTDYLASQPDYTPRSYQVSREMQERIYEHWHATIDRWGYELGGRKKEGVLQTA